MDRVRWGWGRMLTFMLMLRWWCYVDEDETSRLAHCANCYFAFCTECHQQWHPAKPCFSELSDSDMDDEEKSKKSSNKAQKKENTETVEAAVRRKRRQKEEHRREMSSEGSNWQMVAVSTKVKTIFSTIYKSYSNGSYNVYHLLTMTSNKTNSNNLDMGPKSRFQWPNHQWCSV